MALCGPVLVRLNLLAEADRRRLRPTEPADTGGRCYRALTEVLAGGDFLPGRSLLPPKDDVVLLRCQLSARLA